MDPIILELQKHDFGRCKEDFLGSFWKGRRREIFSICTTRNDSLYSKLFSKYYECCLQISNYQSIKFFRLEFWTLTFAVRVFQKC